MAFEHTLVVGGGGEKGTETTSEWLCVLSSLPLKMTHVSLMCLDLDAKAAPSLFTHSFTVFAHLCCVYVCMYLSCLYVVCVYL